MRRVALTVLLTLSLLSLSLATGIPQPGERVFTIQVGSFKSKKKALEILEKVKDLPYARISYRKGRFKVRVGFFRTFKEALKFGKAKNLKRIAPDFFVTPIRFSLEGVEFYTEPKSTEKDEKEKELPKKPSPPPKKTTHPQPQPKDIPPVKSPELKEENKPEGKKHTSFILIGISLLTLSALTAKALRKRKGTDVRESEFERFIASLLKEENYERILEIGIPYLNKHPEDTYVKKAVAESLEKEGRFLEASTLYSEIAEELRKKGLEILADTFEKKAESLSRKEFKGG